ncbi:MAG: DUF3829 domain-containing protein [Deltaproteobacteria bacterium]|nr:DUF3829 domain-containing protein [Deltaproteobacteria bacterium]
MYRIVLLLVLALSFGCKKDNSTTGQPAQEAMGLYAKGFNALIGDPKQMITEYFDRLPDGPQPGTKPSLFPRQNFGASKITEAREAFVAAKKAAPPSLANLAAPAEEALVAIDKIAVAFTAAQKYYEAENYKDDNFAKGKELHQQMVAAAAQYRAAVNKLEDGLSVIEDQQAATELAKHESAHGYSYMFRFYNIEAKKFLSAVERAQTPEQRGALPAAFQKIAAADEELGKFVAAKGAKVNGAFKSYAGMASSYQATAVKILRLVKDNQDPSAEMDALVRNYNSLVTMASSLYQLEDANALN